MLLDIRFEQVDWILLDCEGLVFRNDVCFLDVEILLISHHHNAAVFDPPVIVVGGAEVPKEDVNGVSIIWYEQVMGYVQFDELVRNDTEHERQRVSHLRKLNGLILFFVWLQDQGMDSLAFYFVDGDRHRVLHEIMITKLIYSWGLIKLDFSQGFC